VPEASVAPSSSGDSLIDEEWNLLRDLSTRRRDGADPSEIARIENLLKEVRQERSQIEGPSYRPLPEYTLADVSPSAQRTETNSSISSSSTSPNIQQEHATGWQRAGAALSKARVYAERAGDWAIQTIENHPKKAMAAGMVGLAAVGALTPLGAIIGGGAAYVLYKSQRDTEIVLKEAGSKVQALEARIVELRQRQQEAGFFGRARIRVQIYDAQEDLIEVKARIVDERGRGGRIVERLKQEEITLKTKLERRKGRRNEWKNAQRLLDVRSRILSLEKNLKAA
jgi:hypothetical protein